MYISFLFKANFKPQFDRNTLEDSLTFEQSNSAQNHDEDQDNRSRYFVPPDHKSLKSPVSYQMTRFGLEGSPDDTKVLSENS